MDSESWTPVNKKKLNEFIKYNDDIENNDIQKSAQIKILTEKVNQLEDENKKLKEKVNRLQKSLDNYANRNNSTYLMKYA